MDGGYGENKILIGLSKPYHRTSDYNANFNKNLTLFYFYYHSKCVFDEGEFLIGIDINIFQT